MTAAKARRIDLTGELTIMTATEHNQRVLSFLVGGKNVQLGLAGVTDLDTAGLQVLLLARREAERLGVTLAFCDPSRAVTDVLAIAHLDTALNHGTPPGADLEE